MYGVSRLSSRATHHKANFLSIIHVHTCMIHILISAYSTKLLLYLLFFIILYNTGPWLLLFFIIIKFITHLRNKRYAYGLWPRPMTCQIIGCKFLKTESDALSALSTILIHVQVHLNLCHEIRPIIRFIISFSYVCHRIPEGCRCQKATRCPTQ